MKTYIKLSLLFVAFAIIQSIKAQVAITPSNFPKSWNKSTYVNFQNPTVYSQIAIVGSQVTWDFSHVVDSILVKDSTVEMRTFYPVTNTQNSPIYATNYITSNIGGNKSITYYLNTDSTLEKIYPVNQTFSHTAVIAYKNLEYGDSIISYSEDGTSSQGSSVSSLGKADGWGKLKLPNGEFEALRVRVVIASSSWDQSGGGGDYEEEYIYWYNPTKGNYIAKAYVDGNNVNYFEYLTNENLAIKEIIDTKNIVNIYPNPASNTIQLNSNLNINQVVIYNAIGEQVKTVTLNNGVKTVDINELSNGIYIVYFPELNQSAKVVVSK